MQALQDASWQKKSKKVRTKIRFSISLKGTALPRKKKKKCVLQKKRIAAGWVSGKGVLWGERETGKIWRGG
jgi:hypothetical protein